MRILLDFIATFCLLLLGVMFCGGMREIGPELAAAAGVPDSSKQATAPATVAAAPQATPLLPLALPAQMPVEVAAALRQVHLARGSNRMALMLDFTSTVNFQTEYELRGNRLGIMLSPVERSTLAGKRRDLESSFGPVEVETESRFVQKLWLTLGEGVSPSAQTRASSGLSHTLLLDFEVAGVDRSAEVLTPVRSGRLSPGKREPRGRGLVAYRYRWSSARDGAGSDVYVDRVDPARGDFVVKLALARGRIHARQTLSAIATSESAAAALNAGFFAIHGNGDPLGLLVADGRLLSAPVYSRSAIGIFPDGSVLFGNPELSGHVRSARGMLAIDALNCARTPGKLVLYTSEYGARTGTRGGGFEAAVSAGRVVALGPNDLAIPPHGYVISFQGEGPGALADLRTGASVSYQYGLTPPWNSSVAAVGCGPRLLKDGKAVTDYEAEHFTKAFAMERAPRSGVGLTSSGKLLLVAVDGRRPRQTVGVSLSELADIFRSLGAVDALNMDGGGSTESWLAPEVFNSPSDGHERPICSALLVVGRQPQRFASGDASADRG